MLARPDAHIRHLVEPTRLCLAWSEPGRRRYVVGELTKDSQDSVSLRYLPASEDYRLAAEEGFCPLPAFSDSNKTYTTNVMDFFMSRITRRTRRDFPTYLRNLGIPPEMADDVSDFALLGYGEGRLPSDGYHVVNDYEGVEPPFEFVTEVAAVMHCDFKDRTGGIAEGNSIILEPEPKNRHDQNAVQIRIGDQKLGYINRIQAPTIKTHIESGRAVSGQIFRKNGLPSAPRIFVFLSIE